MGGDKPNGTNGAMSHNGAKKNGNGNGKRGRGRPRRVFTEKQKQIILEMAGAGATDREIAERVKCCRVTLYKAFREDPEFLNTIKGAKARVDGRVVRSLLERALGYNFTERREGWSEKRGDYSEKIERHHPADTNAIRLWLINRQPDKWRGDRQQLEIKGENIFEVAKAVLEKTKQKA